MTLGIRITFIAISLCFLSTEVFSCFCGRAWRNSFLSNVGRFDVIALGTIGPADDQFVSYLTIKKLYKGEVKDSVIYLINGGLDCKHIWISLTDDEVVVGLFKETNQHDKNDMNFYGAGCITSILLLHENKKLISNSNQINYGGQIRKPRISWLLKKMKLRGFERRIYLKLLFHKSEEM